MPLNMLFKFCLVILLKNNSNRDSLVNKNAYNTRFANKQSNNIK